MKPFMYGTVLLTDASTDAMLIPTSSILQQEDNCYVIVAESGNTFRRVNIGVSGSVENKSVVTDGLKVGDKLVVEGAFYLLDVK